MSDNLPSNSTDSETTVCDSPSLTLQDLISVESGVLRQIGEKSNRPEIEGAHGSHSSGHSSSGGHYSRTS